MWEIRSVVSIGGHEEVPVVALQVLEDDPLAVVESPLAVGQEGGLVDPVFVVAHRGLRPADGAVEADLLRELCREVVGLGDGHGRAPRVEVHGRAVDLQLLVRVEREELDHAVDLDQEVEREGEWDPLAGLAGLQSDLRALNGHLGRALALLPTHLDGHVHVLAGGELLEAALLALAELPPLPLRPQRRLLLLEDGVLGPAQQGFGHAAVEEQPLQMAAHLGVAFLERGKVGGPIVRRTRWCRGCREGAARRASPRGGHPREEK